MTYATPGKMMYCRSKTCFLSDRRRKITGHRGAVVWVSHRAERDPKIWKKLEEDTMRLISNLLHRIACSNLIYTNMMLRN